MIKGHQVRSLAKGEVLIKEGENSDSLFFVQDGSFEIKKRKGKQDILLGHVHAGELVGEMSFLDQAPRCATVIAINDCQVIEIPHDKYLEFFESQPNWYQALIKTLLFRLRNTNARIRI